MRRSILWILAILRERIVRGARRGARHGESRGFRPVVVTATLAFTTMAAPGCLRDPDPIELDEDAVAVHALLEAGADTVLVLISRPAPSTDEFGPWNAYVGVSGAEVRLIDGADTTWVTEDRASPCVHVGFALEEPEEGAGCYRATLDRPIESGVSYALEIALPDGTRVTGQATAPEPPVMRTPEPGLRVTVECGEPDTCDPAPGPQNPTGTRAVAVIPVGWERPQSVADIQVSLRPVAIYLDGTAYPGDACSLGRVFGSGGAGRDTMDFEVYNVYCGLQETDALRPARFDSIQAVVTIYGLDAHYAVYIENGIGQGIREEAASQGLDGAYGVFGGLAPAARAITLVRDPPPDSP